MMTPLDIRAELVRRRSNPSNVAASAGVSFSTVINVIEGTSANRKARGRICEVLGMTEEAVFGAQTIPERRGRPRKGKA